MEACHRGHGRRAGAPPARAARVPCPLRSVVWMARSHRHDRPDARVPRFFTERASGSRFVSIFFPATHAAGYDSPPGPGRDAVRQPGTATRWRSWTRSQHQHRDPDRRVQRGRHPGALGRAATAGGPGRSLGLGPSQARTHLAGRCAAPVPHAPAGPGVEPHAGQRPAVSPPREPGSRRGPCRPRRAGRGVDGARPGLHHPPAAREPVLEGGLARPRRPTSNAGRRVASPPPASSTPPPVAPRAGSSSIARSRRSTSPATSCSHGRERREFGDGPQSSASSADLLLGRFAARRADDDNHAVQVARPSRSRTSPSAHYIYTQAIAQGAGASVAARPGS